MPRGRKAKPSTIAWLEGDAGRRRRYKVEPLPPEGQPVKPEHLDEIASAEWDQTIKLMADMGILSKADTTALILYVESYSRYRKAADQVAKYGSVMVAKKTGYVYVSPYVAVMNKSLKDCHSLLSEFGLTPAARARLSVKADAQPDNKWMNLVG